MAKMILSKLASIIAVFLLVTLVSGCERTTKIAKILKNPSVEMDALSAPEWED